VAKLVILKYLPRFISFFYQAKQKLTQMKVKEQYLVIFYHITEPVS